MIKNRKAAIGFIFITLLIDVTGLGLIIPVVPKLIEDLLHTTNISKVALFGGLLTFSYAIMQFLFAPVLGNLSDKYGRRPVLLFSLLGFGLDYLLLAFAPSIGWLFVGRIIAGITGATSNTTSTVISFELGNIDAKYLTLNDSVVGVKSILPFSSRTRGIDLFDIRYQILLNDLYSLQSTDIIYYSQVKTQLQMINDLLVGIKPLQFNKNMNRLYVSMDWKTDISVGDFMVVECYRILDPNTFTDVYNDMFLKEYATALLKRQWGINLKKFEGVQLPGGVTLNGQKIYDEAIEEIRQLRVDADLRYQLPVEFFTG